MAYNIEVVIFLKPVQLIVKSAQVKSSPIISAPIYVMYIKNQMKITDIDYQTSCIKEFDLCLACLHLVYPVLLVSLDSLVALLVFSNIYLIIFLKVE